MATVQCGWQVFNYSKVVGLSTWVDCSLYNIWHAIIFLYRNTHGLIKAIMKLLQMQAVKEGHSGEKNIQDIYNIR